ncbi:MAG: hypothetical protein ACLFUG_01060 [Nitriliruptoraceae bacterium]
MLLLSVTVLTAAVPFLPHLDVADASAWVLVACVAGIALVSRTRRRGGPYRADLASVLLLVQGASLYLLADERAEPWFLVMLTVVLLATATLLRTGPRRAAAIGAVLLTTTAGWWASGTAGVDLIMLVLALVSLIVLVLLLERRYEHGIERHRDEQERHRQSVALLSAISDLSGDAHTVRDGITRALAQVGFDGVLIVRQTGGHLEPLGGGDARTASWEQERLRHLVEETLAAGQRTTATIPWDATDGSLQDTGTRQVVLVPIPGSVRPQGVLCGFAPADRALRHEAVRWAGTLAGYLGTRWQREEALELEHAHLLATERLERTRSAFLDSVSAELTPRAAAVRARAGELLEAREQPVASTTLTQLRGETDQLRAAVEALLLMADVAREPDQDPRSGGHVTIEALADELALRGVELQVDPALRGSRLLARPRPLARALALWLSPDGSRCPGRLAATRVADRAVIRVLDGGPGTDGTARANPHRVVTDRLLVATGAAEARDGGVHLDLATSEQGEHR